MKLLPKVIINTDTFPHILIDLSLFSKRRRETLPFLQQIVGRRIYLPHVGPTGINFDALVEWRSFAKLAISLPMRSRTSCLEDIYYLFLL